MVLYNDDEDHGEETELLLSNICEGEGDMEARAHVVDINCEKRKEIFSNCRILEEYPIFVAKVRKYRDEDYELSEAIEEEENVIGNYR